MKDVKFIIERIKELCDLKGITVHRLLVHCGLNTTLVANMQRKGTIPSVKSISKIAEYFDVTIEYLIGNSNIPSGQPTLVSLSKNAFGERLQELRTAHGVSQSEVAKYLVITRQGYNNYETGKREPDYNTLIKIANYFKVSTDYLLGNQKFAPVFVISETTSVFGHMLQQLRKSKKFSQAALSKELGVAQSTVGMWESGKREPDYGTLIRVANYFHVSVDYLLGSQFTPDAENSNRNKDSSLTKEEIQTFSNEVQTALNKLLKSLQQEDEA